MKKSIISTLALGIIIGAGITGAKSFADEVSFDNLQNTNQGIENIQQGEYGFRTMNQENNGFENIDNSQYDNENGGYGYRNCCPYRGY